MDKRKKKFNSKDLKFLLFVNQLLTFLDIVEQIHVRGRKFIAGKFIASEELQKKNEEWKSLKKPSIREATLAVKIKETRFSNQSNFNAADN